MDSIKLKNIEYPFLFAVKAQRELSRMDSSEMDDISLIWLALKYGALKEGKKFVLTENDLLDIFEDDVESNEKSYEDACKLLTEHLGKLKKMKGDPMIALQ